MRELNSGRPAMARHQVIRGLWGMMKKVILIPFSALLWSGSLVHRAVGTCFQTNKQYYKRRLHFHDCGQSKALDGQGFFLGPQCIMCCIYQLKYIDDANNKREEKQRKDWEKGGKTVREYRIKTKMHNREGRTALGILLVYKMVLPIFLLFHCIMFQLCTRKGLDWGRR